MIDCQRFLIAKPFKAKRKAGRPRLGRGKDVIKKDLREMGTAWEGVKREALTKLNKKKTSFFN